MTSAMKAQMRDNMHNCQTVPREVFEALNECMFDRDGNDLPRDRESLTKAIARVMARDGWTFCACYRHENSPAHALVYALVSTVGANHLAEEK